MAQLMSFKLTGEPEFSSSSSISINAGGGNLTSSDKEESTTLSSSEEYQLARHDLYSEEERADSGERVDSGEGKGGAFSRIEIGANAATPGESGQQVKPANLQVQIGNEPRQLAPSGDRANQGGINRLIGRQRLANSAPVNNPDSVSQCSLGQRGQTIMTNHFEVRWQEICLHARKSRLPAFIVENPIYRLFERYRGDSGESNLEESLAKGGSVSASAYPSPMLNKKAHYSPQVKQKLQLLPRLMLPPPPTISEDLELSNSRGRPLDNEISSEESPPDSPPSSPSPQLEWGRPILSNISGSVFSGQLTAILGPSGVGKTSLLNSLTGRNSLDGTGRVSLLGGASKRMSVVTVPQSDVLPGKLTVIEDLRFTSRLKNVAKGFDHERNIERIARHLQMEKFLNTRIDKLSGGEERRLSIGRELLNSPDIMILDEPTSGLDANTCKKIITALRDIVERSDNILARPMAVIITIHQPQQEVLNLFHRVYVMAVGGRAIYEGPPSNLLPTLVEQSSLSRMCAIEQLNENPAIVAIEVASGEYGNSLIGELAMHHESQVYGDSYFAEDGTPRSTPRCPRSARKSPLSVSPRFDHSLLNRRSRLNSFESGGRPTPVLLRQARYRAQQAALANMQAGNTINGTNNANLDKMSAITSVSYASTYDADLPEPYGKLKVDKRLRRSVVMKSAFLSHTLTLMARCWLLSTRDLFLMAIRVLGFFLVGAGIAQIFHEALDPDEHLCPLFESEVDDLYSFMEATKGRVLNMQHLLRQNSSTRMLAFQLIMSITIVTSALTGLLFPQQMRMFMREYKNGWYSPAAFIASQTLAELPVDIIGPTISVLIIYPLCGQPASDYYWREMVYILILGLSSVICKSQAQIVGAFFVDSVQNSVFIACVVVIVPMLTSGIAVPLIDLPKPIQWASYASFLRYTFESVLVVRYGYGLCPCDPQVVDGYPINTSVNAMPAHLNSMMRSFMELNQATDTGALVNATTALAITTTTNNDEGLFENPNNNLFLKFLRLINDASNIFVNPASDLGDCSRFRSLGLMTESISDRILPEWLSAMFIMFVLSRFLTYFIVTTVIKTRRQ